MTNLAEWQDPALPRQLALACHLDSKRWPQGFLGATDSVNMMAKHLLFLLFIYSCCPPSSRRCPAPSC